MVFDEFITLLPYSDLIEKNTLYLVIENHDFKDNVEDRGRIPRECRYASSYPKNRF